MAVSALEFAQAGCRRRQARRVLFRHILPNTISPIIVQATLDLGYVILAASLSFIALGVPPGEPEWAQRCRRGQHVGTAWWVIIFPGLAILLTVLGFNLLGNGIATCSTRAREKRPSGDSGPEFGWGRGAR